MYIAHEMVRIDGFLFVTLIHPPSCCAVDIFATDAEAYYKVYTDNTRAVYTIGSNAASAVEDAKREIAAQNGYWPPKCADKDSSNVIAYKSAKVFTNFSVNTSGLNAQRTSDIDYETTRNERCRECT